MAIIRSIDEARIERAAYGLVCRAQYSIASYLKIGDGDLSKYLERDAFNEVANRLTDKYFHRSRDLEIASMVQRLYVVLLILAPILQRLSLSMKFDWHLGHVISFIRANTNRRIRRFYFGIRTVERSYRPDDVRANIARLGICDSLMIEELMDLYRRHAGGTALKDLLAHQIFDPIILSTEKQGCELRCGSTLLRLEKEPFPGSIDLRYEPASIGNYTIRSCENRDGHHVEIFISESCLKRFRDRVDGILSTPSAPDYKLSLLGHAIRDFVEQTRHARSGFEQLLELKVWLSRKLQRLAGTSPDVKSYHNILINLWLQRQDPHLHLKAPNFFLNSSKVEEKAYLTFFSPYREVAL